MGPLLLRPVMEPDLTSLIQEIFLVAKDPDDQQLQQYAAWAVSFLRHYLTFREARNEDSNFPNEASGAKSVSQSFPENSLVMKLSLWLMHLNYHGVGLFSQQCLSKVSSFYLKKLLVACLFYLKHLSKASL